MQFLDLKITKYLFIFKILKIYKKGKNMKKNKLNIDNKTEKFVKIVPRSYVYQQPIKSLVFLKKLNINQNFMIGKNWIVVQPNEKDLNLARKINYYSTKEPKNCIVCNVKFYHGRSNARRCNYHKIYSICTTCNFLHIINLNNLSGTANVEIIEAIQNNEEIQSFCSSECLYNYINNLEIIKENARKNCDKMNFRIHSFCEKCNKITNHNGFGTCLECNPIFTEQFCVVCNKNTRHRNNNCCICNGNGYHLEYCKNCDEETMHNGSICCNCNPSSNGQYGVNGKVNRPYVIKFCEKCNCETPHKKNNKIIL